MTSPRTDTFRDIRLRRALAMAMDPRFDWEPRADSEIRAAEIAFRR